MQIHPNKWKKFDNIKDAFYAYVTTTDKDKCWEWEGATQLKNLHYGKLWFKNKCYLAHRISYRLHKGDIPKDLCVMHICDNAKCVNPDHLKTGTNTENMQDCTDKGRRPYKKGYQPFQFRDLYGEKNGNAKVTNIQINEIKDKFRRGVSASSLMAEYGLSKTNIYRYRKIALEEKEYARG